MANFFCRSRPTTTWASGQVHALGVRRLSTGTVPARGIHFEVTTAGTTGAAEPAWNTTVGGATTDNTVTWTTRGSAADWVASTAYVLGDRVVGITSESIAEQNFVFECTTAGTSGAGPNVVWNTTIGGTTTDNTVTWTTRACTTWDNAHIRLEKFTATTVAAGDTIFVGDEHTQTSATADFNPSSVGTRTNPVKYVCVNDTGDPVTPTTVATTGSINTTGAVDITWTGTGFSYVFGLIFNCGTGAAAARFTTGNTIFESCAVKLLTTNISSGLSIDLSTAGFCVVKFINTTIQFSAAGQGIAMGNTDFEWLNTPTALVLGTVPTVLFETGTDAFSVTRIHGVDLANLNTTLIAIGTGTNIDIFDIYNCKLHASMTLTSGTHPGIGSIIRMINCDSGDTNTNTQVELGEGSLTDELTIVRTGGASDGTTAFSQRVVTRATTPRFEFPFISLPITQWNDTTGSAKTATVEIINDGLTLTDKEVWVEVEYLGTSGFPLSLFVDDAAADILATAASQATSTATWTTTGLTTPIKQKLEVTFTPQEKGPLIARVMVARPSTTLFIDPLVTIT